MGWTKVTTVARLEQGPLVYKHGPRQLALFRVDGVAYAVDNRCPHEGYPLAQGTVDGEGVLTCNWHNWKFRLGDGRCLLGGDDVRAWPLREEGGDVLVDLSEPDPAELLARILRGLRGAFDERDYGRICRELSRLRFHGLDPAEALERAVEWSHDRLEYGTTHAYAGCADWLAESARYPDDWEARLVCLAEAVDHMAHDALRQPVFPYAAPGAPWDERRFLAAVEVEQREEVEGAVRRALDDGLGFDALEAGLAEAALAHLNDFGHSLIYVAKTAELLQRTDARLARWLAPALARHLAYTTREDLLPEFEAYAAMLAALPEPRPDGSRTRPATPFPASLREAFAWLSEALAAHPLEAVFDALVEALARNLLHFDSSFGTAVDRPVQDNVGWLDFTHGLTFADAAREVCGRHPRLWRPALLQMACFVGRNRAFLDLELDGARWAVDDPDAFLGGLHERLLDHGLRDPIFSVHLLKTTRAVERLLDGASPAARGALLAGLHRFTSSPLKQKHARRLARQAIELVGRDFR